MNNQFSTLNRNNILDTMGKEHYDLIIIGGGITGAGIAYDAVTRGLKVALVEMQDFAAGTSSRSTKLVHGGLRYLKQFEIKEVADLGKERAIVYENGPHVTTPEWMLLPFHKGGTFGKFTTSIGLWMYDHLAKVKRSERRTMLSAEETLEKEPLIKKEGLKGGGYYVEYRTDDARLTIEVMKAAVAKGAHALNYVKATSFLYNEHKKVIGIKAKDMLTNKEINIYANKTVNATGPWVDEVRMKDYSRNDKQLRLTKGIHLIIDQKHFPLQQAVYFDTPDGRMIFAIPRDGKAYVGTTDTFYDGDTASPRPTTEDRDYLLRAIDYMFPDAGVKKEHIESSYAGVRPLIYEEGKDPSEISRKDEIWEGESGLITIAGGKLTGYRKMAETVVDLVVKELSAKEGKSFGPCLTKQLPISGGDVGGSDQFPSFVETKVQEMVAAGFSEEMADILVRRYGSNIDQLIAYSKSYHEEKEALPLSVYSELMYTINEEMVVKPVDFFIRRTGVLLFEISEVRKWEDMVISKMATIFEWTDSETEKYKHELEKEMNLAAFSYDN